MLSAWLLCAILSQASWAGDDTAGQAMDTDEKPSFEMLGILMDVIDESPAAGKGILQQAVTNATKEASRQPIDKRSRVVEQHMPAINTAAEAIDVSTAPESARRINDAMAQFNNSAGHYEEAVRFASHALAQDPADRSALISRSIGNIGLNRLDAAYADADKAAKLAPEDTTALRARAMAAYEMRNYLQATQDAERALALNPNDRQSYYIMQLAQAKVPALKLDKLQAQIGGEVQREYHGMVQQLNQAAARSQQPAPQPPPQSIETLLREASAKIQVRDYAGSIAAANRALAADPDNAEAYYYRAAAENLLGNYDQAAADATRALMLQPSDVGSHDARAWAYINLGRFRDAIADSHHSLEVNPLDAYAFSNLAHAHEHQGDLAAMLQAYKKAALLNPQFEPAYKDAAARHGLEPEALPSDKFRDHETQETSASERSRRRSFAVVVLSSVIGGLLIALGFVHLYIDAKTPPAPKPAPPEPPGLPELPVLAAGYVLGPAIGAGGMGVVYEAFDKALERAVAVKIMRPELSLDPQARARFLQEARTVAALHHPAIVDIHAIVEDHAALCLIFERIEGRTLEDILNERRRLSLAEARALLKPVCQGLEFAHRHGVVHRDLKPGNIMVASTGQVKLMDFGISRHERAACGPLTPAEQATIHGTPYYMAPEQELGEVRRESDVFSLGACLYEMVTGQRPYPAPFGLAAKLSREYERPSRVVPGLPAELDRIMDWALHPDPQERIRSASDLGALLDRLHSPQPAAA